MSKPHTLNPADKVSLIRYLSSFYSIGQLQIIYCTLTDASPYPGLTDFERAARIEAIDEILNNPVMNPKPDVQPAIEPVAGPDEIAALFPLAKAQRVARIVFDMLEEYCDLIHIAGSIRRQKPEVKDVEIVCRPKLFAEADFSLFGGSGELKITPAFRRTVEHSLGTLLKGKADGRYMQILLPSGLKLDLFMPQSHDYYRQLAIRTGPADYSARVIAGGWKNLGWCGTADGLRRMSQCEETKSGWKCLSKEPILPPVWQSEAEFFTWLNVPYLDPQNRI